MASAGITQAPTFFEPMNTPLWLAMAAGGTDYNLPGFRFIVDTYTYTKDANGYTNTKQFVARTPFPAGPDFKGYMSPHTLLKPYQKSSVQPSISNVRLASENAVKYILQGGLGWNPQLYFGAINRGGAITPGANWTSAKKPKGVTYDGSQTYYYQQIVLSLPFSSGPSLSVSGLSVGDMINVFYYDTAKQVYAQGKVKVLAINNSSFYVYNLITVDAIYSTTEWGNGGSNIPNSSASPSINVNGEVDDTIRMGAFTEELVTVNGTKQQTQLTKNWFLSSMAPNETDYTRADYYTKWPYKDHWKKIYRNQLETVDFSFYPFFPTNSYKVVAYDKNKTVLGTRYINWGSSIPYTDINNTRWYFYSVQVGYDKIMAQAVPSAVNAFPTVKFYTVQIGFGNSGPSNYYSLPLRYEIVDEDCYHENVRMCWLNRKGGYDYFNFSHSSTRKVSIERTEWTKQQPIIATISDRAASVLAVSANETFTASTEYLDSVEMAFLEDLYTSLDVYTVQPDGTLIPIVIVNEPTFDTYDPKSGKLAAVTINYKANTPINIQGT